MIRDRRDPCLQRTPPLGVAELHLHMEGSLSIPSAIELAHGRHHRWGSMTASEIRKELRFDSFSGFLAAIRDMCFILCSAEGLERASRELSLFLSRHGVAWAEVYCSPLIYIRWGMEPSVVFEALDRGFADGERLGGTQCVILLDSVRQWGPDAASRVLEHHAASPLPRVVGFGLGGEETVPLDEFRDVFKQARALGLRTLVHAGEMAGSDDVRAAIDKLEVDRVAHGIGAVDDPGLLAEIARRKIPLDVALTSNYRTGAVRGAHPIRKLIDHGIKVTLGSDDPSLFRTNLRKEFQRAAMCCELTRNELIAIARNGIDASFAEEEMRARLHDVLDARVDGKSGG